MLKIECEFGERIRPVLHSLFWCVSVKQEFVNEGLCLLVSLHPYLHLWVWAVCSEEKRIRSQIQAAEL